MKKIPRGLRSQQIRKKTSPCSGLRSHFQTTRKKFFELAGAITYSSTGEVDSGKTRSLNVLRIPFPSTPEGNLIDHFVAKTFHVDDDKRVETITSKLTEKGLYDPSKDRSSVNEGLQGIYDLSPNHEPLQFFEIYIDILAHYFYPRTNSAG